MKTENCFDLKGSLFTLTVLQLYHNDLACLCAELEKKVKLMPLFFNHTPVVIDLHLLDAQQQEIDFKQLKKIICKLHMIPVGVKGATDKQKIALDEAGLAFLAEAKPATQGKKLAAESEISDKTNIQNRQNNTTTITQQQSHFTPTDPEQTAQTNTTTNRSTTPIPTTKQPTDTRTANHQSKTILQNIRSGQQVYAPNGDLIIMGSVSPGAEILADGNIHVYGALRGRALAGIKGDKNSGIFCQNLQSELISIAGIYLLCDDIPPTHVGQANYISLRDEKLDFQFL